MISHRPFCAAAAIGLLLFALGYGNPFARRQPAAQPTPRQGQLADPDGVGACPVAAESPVVRRGLNEAGHATWWHADGSITVREPSDPGTGASEPAVVRLGQDGRRMAPVAVVSSEASLSAQAMQHPPASLPLPLEHD